MRQPNRSARRPGAAGGMIRRLGILAASVVGVAAFTAPQAAQASALAYDTGSCDVTFSSCNTRSIPSHATQHWIEITVSTSLFCGANFQLIDSSNGAVVATGSIGANRDVSGTVYGLYGSYYLHVYNSCWDTTGVIANWN